jgi:predicted transcriptional regulator
MLVLEALAEKRAISKSAILRQALRLYESVETRLDQGERLYLESANKKDKSELLLI